MKLRNNPRSNNQLRDIIRSNKYNTVTTSPTTREKRNILRLKITNSINIVYFVINFIERDSRWIETKYRKIYRAR